MPDHPLPKWVDRKTAEWAAGLADHASAEFIRCSMGEAARGARAAATTIRAAIAAGKGGRPADCIPAADFFAGKAILFRSGNEWRDGFIFDTGLEYDASTDGVRQGDRIGIVLSLNENERTSRKVYWRRRAQICERR